MIIDTSALVAMEGGRSPGYLCSLIYKLVARVLLGPPRPRRIIGLPYEADVEKAKGLEGKSVGDGQCVALVHEAVPTPSSSLWKAGDAVRGNQFIKPGTVIATFGSNGKYGNRLDGSSHAAIYLGQDAAGIHVIDQWKGPPNQPAHERVIRFKGSGPAVDDGTRFRVAE